MSTNLALNKVATASGSVMPYSPAKAVNGSYIQINPTSRWLSNKMPAWLLVDLGAVYCFNRWVVRHMPTAGWRVPDYCMADYKLQGSNDGNTWSDIDSIVGNKLGISDRTIPAVNFRYARVYVTKGLQTNVQFASIMELEIYQADNVATLSNLSVNSGILTPIFNSSTTAYTDNVTYDVASINIMPVVTDPRAKITVNGVAAASGAATPVPLNYGANAITVQVTAADNTTKLSYVTTVTRTPSPLLSSMVINGLSTALPFNSGTFSYNTSVGYDTTSVTVSLVAQDSNAVIKVNDSVVKSGETSGQINLNVGDNTINVVVTTAGGVSKTYTVVVTRLNSLYLGSLVLAYTGPKLTPGSVTITVNHSTLQYSTNVPQRASQVTITPNAEYSGAAIQVNGQSVASGVASVPIDISGTTTSINIVVSDVSGNKQYQMIVSKV